MTWKPRKGDSNGRHAYPRFRQTPRFGKSSLEPRAIQDGRLLARGKLSIRRADLLARESSFARAVEDRSHQAALAGTLGHDSRVELHLCAHEPGNQKVDLDAIYIAGPGHGGPGLVANTYLEGTYSEFYPNIQQSEEGMQRLFKQFSFPGGIPSHVAPETPGSIHEGGELGYSVAHANGAAFDNPELLVCCVVGDGEAETGALAASWHSNKFLNPARDGAVLPILQLNGYKIANPTVLARMSDGELAQLFAGYGYDPYSWKAAIPTLCISSWPGHSIP